MGAYPLVAQRATVVSDLVAWERQPGEPSRSYHAFAHYRDLGTSRSVDKAWRLHKTACDAADRSQVDSRRSTRQWNTWASQWDWLTRVELYDADLDRQQRERLVKAQMEARERHGRIAQGTLTVISGATRAMLEAYQDPNVVKALSTKAKSGSDGALAVLQVIIRGASAIPSLVSVERMALGLTTESVEIHDKREVSTLASRIAADPEATDLAIRLLDRIAGTGVRPALGPGASGESADLEDGAPSEPAGEEVGGPGTAADQPAVRGDAPPTREE